MKKTVWDKMVAKEIQNICFGKKKRKNERHFQEIGDKLLISRITSTQPVIWSKR